MSSIWTRKKNGPKLQSTTIILDGPKLRSAIVILDGPKLRSTTIILGNPKLCSIYLDKDSELHSSTVILDRPNGRLSKFTLVQCNFGHPKDAIGNKTFLLINKINSLITKSLRHFFLKTFLQIVSRHSKRIFFCTDTIFFCKLSAGKWPKNL